MVTDLENGQAGLKRVKKDAARITGRLVSETRRLMSIPSHLFSSHHLIESMAIVVT